MLLFQKISSDYFTPNIKTLNLGLCDFADRRLMSICECLQEKVCASDHRSDCNYVLIDTLQYNP